MVCIYPHSSSTHFCVEWNVRKIGPWHGCLQKRFQPTWSTRMTPQKNLIQQRTSNCHRLGHERKKVCADNQIHFLISLSHLIRRLLFKKAETSNRNKCRICILINSGITWLEQELKLIYFQWAACPGTCSSNCTSKNRINRKLFENKGHTPTLPKDVSGYVHPWLRNCKFWNTKREHEQNS